MILMNISPCYLPFLPQSQLLKRYITKKRLTMPQTVGNYFLHSRISLANYLHHQLPPSTDDFTTFFPEKVTIISGKRVYLD